MSSDARFCTWTRRASQMPGATLLGAANFRVGRAFVWISLSLKRASRRAQRLPYSSKRAARRATERRVIWIARCFMGTRGAIGLQ